jgi:hypothetical protein
MTEKEQKQRKEERKIAAGQHFHSDSYCCFEFAHMLLKGEPFMSQSTGVREDADNPNA